MVGLDDGLGVGDVVGEVGLLKSAKCKLTVIGNIEAAVVLQLTMSLVICWD